MTGFDKLQLMQYDLTDGTGKISTVEEQEGFAGNIGIAGEKLYFAAQNEGEKGTVYAVDTAQHTREKLTEGISFAISPDVKYMALCRPRPIVDEVQYVDVVPVSYTHLDVYKRQVLDRTLSSIGKKGETVTINKKNIDRCV